MKTRGAPAQTDVLVLTGRTTLSITVQIRLLKGFQGGSAIILQLLQLSRQSSMAKAKIDGNKKKLSLRSRLQ